MGLFTSYLGVRRRRLCKYSYHVFCPLSVVGLYSLFHVAVGESLGPRLGESLGPRFGENRGLRLGESL